MDEGTPTPAWVRTDSGKVAIAMLVHKEELDKPLSALLDLCLQASRAQKPSPHSNKIRKGISN